MSTKDDYPEPDAQGRILVPHPKGVVPVKLRGRHLAEIERLTAMPLIKITTDGSLARADIIGVILMVALRDDTTGLPTVIAEFIDWLEDNGEGESPAEKLQFWQPFAHALVAESLPEKQKEALLKTTRTLAKSLRAIAAGEEIELEEEAEEEDGAGDSSSPPDSVSA